MSKDKIILDTILWFVKSEMKHYKNLKKKFGVKNTIGHYHQTKYETYEFLLNYINELKEGEIQ